MSVVMKFHESWLTVFGGCGPRQNGSALDPGMPSGLLKEEACSNQSPFPWPLVWRIWWQSASAGIRLDRPAFQVLRRTRNHSDNIDVGLDVAPCEGDGAC